MTSIILSLAPLFIVLMTGNRLRASGFLSLEFFKGVEKLTYWALLPSLFFITMAKADFTGLSLLPPILATAALLGVSMVLLVITRPLFPSIDGPSYSSVIQGATRFNNYVGLPVTLSLFGQEGIVVYAIIISAMIPLTNITSVWALTHYATHGAMNWGQLISRIFTNPLIISTLAGIGFSISGLGSPPVIGDVIQMFADASVLMGLLAIGASLNLSAVKTEKFRVMYSCFWKLIIFPTIAIGVGLVFGLDSLSMKVLILFAALPTATSSFILATQMGGNATMMANVVATETLLAFATMPVWLWLAMAYF